jgi:hypothetical protein
MTRAITTAAIVISIDAITKAVMPTPDWAWHHRGTGWTAQAIVGCLLAIMLLACGPLRLTAALLFAGVFGNLISSLHGDVANPLVGQLGSHEIAFNIADLSLLVALATALGASPGIARNIARWNRLSTKGC